MNVEKVKICSGAFFIDVLRWNSSGRTEENRRQPGRDMNRALQVSSVTVRLTSSVICGGSASSTWCALLR